MTAIALLKKLNTPVIPVAKSKIRAGGAHVVIYKDGRREVEISKEWPLGSPDAERMLYHEAGHIIDQAHSLIPNGRSNVFNRFVIGTYSTRHHDILNAAQEVIVSQRTIQMRVGIKGVPVFDISKLDTIEGLSVARRNKLKMKALDLGIVYRRYWRQDVELFAEGFALFMTKPGYLEERCPDAAKMFRTVALEVGAIED